MEPIPSEQSNKSAQDIPPAPTPRKNFLKPFLIFITIILLLMGTVAVLAWRTTYLDEYLPNSIREFLGRGSETPEAPDKTSSDETEPEYEEPQQSPEEVVQECLRKLNACSKTDALSDLINQAAEAQGGGFWYDPLLRAQDIDDTSTTELVRHLGPNTAIVEGTSFSTHKLHFLLQIESGEWKINDVYCPYDPATGMVNIWTEDLTEAIPLCD